MNTKTILQSLFSVIIFFIFLNAVNAQLHRALNGEEAVCTIKADNKIYTVQPDQLGNFDEVSGMYPEEIIAVEVYYPNGLPGEKVVIAVEDGGSLDGGKGINAIKLDNQRKVSFNFKVFDLGSHKISLRKNKDVKTVQIWGEERLINSSSVNKNNVGATTSPSGNNHPKGAGHQCLQCPCPGTTGTNPFVANTGNESRNVKDLEIWGGVGQIEFKWMRFGNSRHGRFRTLLGDAGNWNHSFKYDMSDAGTNSNNQPKIFIHFPEGTEETFTKSTPGSNLWTAPPGIENRLFQSNDTFTLATDKGYRYRFEKLFDQASQTYYQLQSFLDANQNKYRLQYDSFKRLTRITEPAGRYFQIDYSLIDGKEKISQVSTSDGRNVKYHYAILTNSLTRWLLLDSVYYGDGTVAIYTYSQREAGVQPSLEHAVDPRYTGTAVDMKYTYDTTTHFFGFINQEKNGVTGEPMSTLISGNDERTVCYPNGKTEKFDVPANQVGNVTTHVDGLGRTTQYTYAAGTGFLLTKTDALGRTATYNKRTVYGNPLEITYPDGSKEKWTRDNLEQVTAHIDQLLRVTKYKRDANHRIIRIDYPDKSFETFTYNNFAQVLYHRRQNGGIEQSVYNSRGLKTSFTDALKNVTLYTYDNADRLASVTDALGHTTAYSYNERGLLIASINADSTQKFYDYDKFGNQTKIIDELGHSWVTLYDKFRRPVSATDPLGRVTKYNYDLPGGICGCTHDNNKPTKIILPSGKVTEIEYDVEWQKIKETVGAGTADAATTFYEYNLAGNLVSIIDPKEKEWKTEYDSLDRKKASTDPIGNRTTYRYDSVGNVIKIMRPDNGTTLHYFDKMNRDTLTIDPKGQVTKMKYDAEGNVVQLTDAKQNIYRFQYDLLNRRKKFIYPDSASETYNYDSAGNLKTYKTRAGHIRTYVYDKRNREIQSSWISPFPNDITPAISRTYDAAGRQLTVNSITSSLAYSYNEANEVTGESQSVTGSAGSKAIKYSYTTDGLADSVSYPDGTVVKYAYTGRNQVASISVNDAALAKYNYDVNGNRLNKTLNNGTDVTYTYDDADRLLKLLNRKATKSFAGFDYGYDNMSRRTFIKRDNVNGDAYSYDSTDQLIKVFYEVFSSHGTSRTVNYIYDSSGNRISVTDNGKVTNYTSNNLNQYTKVGDNALSYTKNGNLKNLNGWAFTYDAQNRLTKAQKTDTTISFAYDPVNRCVQRKLSKGTTTLSNNFLYYDDWNLIEERNAVDSQTARYVHGAMTDEILTKTSNRIPVYYYYDALGNVVRLTDSTGKVVERYIQDDVFGRVLIRDSAGKSIPSSAYGNRFIFTGREYLKEIKLYDYRNRMYSDSLGRFLQIDPLKFGAGDENFYRYAGNNSLNWIDPYGLETIDHLPGQKGSSYPTNSTTNNDAIAKAASIAKDVGKAMAKATKDVAKGAPSATATGVSAAMAAAQAGPGLTQVAILEKARNAYLKCAEKYSGDEEGYQCHCAQLEKEYQDLSNKSPQ